jgi:hypothetical protein
MIVIVTPVNHVPEPSTDLVTTTEDTPIIIRERSTISTRIGHRATMKSGTLRALISSNE